MIWLALLTVDIQLTETLKQCVVDGSIEIAEWQQEIGLRLVDFLKNIGIIRNGYI